MNRPVILMKSEFNIVGDYGGESTRPSWAHIALRRYRWLLLFIFLPTLITAIYYSLIAADEYVSESRFVIKAPNQRQQQLSTLANLIQTTGLSAGQEQTNEVLDYIRSRNALIDLQRRVDVKKRFQSPLADVFSRYPTPLRRDRFENLYKYYGTMVDAHLDRDTESAVLTVKAFTAQDAQRLNATLLNLSESLVNRLNDRAQSKAIVEARKRVADAENRLRNARLALRTYRNAQSLLDPGKQATGVLEVSNRLVAEQVALRAQMQSIAKVAPQNPAIPALRDRIAAIGTQIAAQNGRAVGTDSGLASKLSEYENRAVEQDFATQALTAASTTLEQARTEAQRQQFYLERVVEPDTPDLALFPKRLKSILVVAAAAACLYFIGWMLIVGILEHAPED